MEAAEPKVFQHDRLYIQVDRGIVEVFRRSNVIGPYRYPLAWVTVYAEARRGGRIRLCFGIAEDLGEPVYGRVPNSSLPGPSRSIGRVSTPQDHPQRGRSPAGGPATGPWATFGSDRFRSAANEICVRWRVGSDEP